MIERKTVCILALHFQSFPPLLRIWTDKRLSLFDVDEITYLSNTLVLSVLSCVRDVDSISASEILLTDRV